MVKKDIRHVRRNIAERKKQKVQRRGSLPTAKIQPPQDEEMHGFPPLVTEERSRSARSLNQGSSQIAIKLLLSGILFAAVAISERTEFSLLEKPEQWLTSQLQEEFPFAKVTAWYSDRFGDPLQLVQPKESSSSGPIALPVNGTVTTPFRNGEKGIVMTTENDSKVKAVQAGTVIFAGNDEETKKTVVLQHKDGSNSIYGYLSSIDVHLYESIQAKDILGSVESTEGQAAEFFFAIEKDKRYLNPVEVIKVDESS